MTKLERDLVQSLTKVLAVANRYRPFTVFTDEEQVAVDEAIALLTEVSQNCDDCVDY